MGIFNKLFSKNNFDNVRIEKLKPIDEKYEIQTDTVWFEPNNIEQCIRATKKLNIEHIHLQTYTLDFLSDIRLKNVKGIYIQFKIEDLTPLKKHKQLTHLRISEENKETFDFSNFPNLIFLNGIGPKNYKNFNQLTKLKYAYLRNYKKKNFVEFTNFYDLRTIEIYSASVENLNGLSSLHKLRELKLEKCPKLKSLNGIDKTNSDLEIVQIMNCKNLTDLSKLGSIQNLNHLVITRVFEIESFKFLSTLPNIEKLYVKPSSVGVKNDDYYPFVNKLKSMGKLDQLKNWKKRNDYLDKKIKIGKNQKDKLSELQLILKNLSIKNWHENYKDGLEQYTTENCQKAEDIISTLIGKLESNGSLTKAEKTELIKLSVLQFNEINDSLDGCFIETGEREELCEIFDNIADAIGIDTQEYEDGIASEWRDW
ncbi:hypothetical protein DCS32_15410 [Dokdonia sp. Dokd-P16]|uniref:DUF5713 family protein n=1 Tax=Dokdonia sp. Dokd-P16 TaxID=2173169 RepID=UPI000D546E91|nr:DUF5713 family protein [Dokdonia sp. Dokd-P16]AWH75499.1 hypothetical protein DCS32_15410 [Dokdonia sp. Dokd-P16]